MARHLAVAVAALTCVALPIIACEIRVRDSAFRTARDVHKLCVIADSNDAAGEKIFSQLRDWVNAEGDALNLDVVKIHSDDPDTRWTSLGIPSAPPRVPVTVLVGRDNGSATNFVIDHWEPSPSASDLEQIASSPVRAELANRLAKHIAVLLYAPLDGAADSARAAEIAAIVDRGIDEERIGLSMMVLDRYDPQERLLCHFMGIREGAPDTLCVAFGRGKLMSPPLIADQITSDNIDQLVTQLRQACSCSQPLPTMGVDVPLKWSSQVDAGVVLMDEELDMSTLATEVQAMLEARVMGSEDDGTDTTAALIPIPSGATQDPQPVARQVPVVGALAYAVNEKLVAGLASLVLISCAIALAVARRLGRDRDHP